MKSNGLKSITIHSGLLLFPCVRNEAVIRDVAGYDSFSWRGLEVLACPVLGKEE